jgi:hypothetical protein
MRFATLDDDKSPSVANRSLPTLPSMPPLTFAGVRIAAVDVRRG